MPGVVALLAGDDDDARGALVPPDEADRAREVDEEPPDDVPRIIDTPETMPAYDVKDHAER